jgi:uncharacterized RDD family membrane protein YckC
MGVEIEDRYVTSTPEGVSLSLVLAGVGSRGAAYMIDIAIQLVAEVIILILLHAVVSGTTSAYVALGIYAFLSFIILFGYFVIFEIFDSGRSPGKHALGIRVTRVDGSGVNFRASLVRNLMRVLYFIPLFYLVDALLILTTKRNQRLGDLLAGTLVVRVRIGAVSSMRGGSWEDPRLWSQAQTGVSPWAHSNPSASQPWSAQHLGGAQPSVSGWGPPGAPPWGGAPPQGWLPPELAMWDVTAVTSADLVVVQAYLARRFQYEPQARQRLAQDLASRIWPKVAGVSVPMQAEQFLEAVALVKSSRG